MGRLNVSAIADAKDIPYSGTDVYFENSFFCSLK